MIEFDQCGIFAAKISYKLSLIRTRISKVGLRVSASHGPGQIACILMLFGMQFDAIFPNAICKLYDIRIGRFRRRGNHVEP